MNRELFGEYTVEYAASKVGSLTVSSEGLKAKFAAACVVATGEILRLAILTGDRYVALGVMLPDGDKLRFSKKFSSHDLKSRGITSIEGCRLVSNLEDISVPKTVPRIAPEPLSPEEPVPDMKREPVLLPESKPEPLFLPKPSPREGPPPLPDTAPEQILLPEPRQKAEPVQEPEALRSWKAVQQAEKPPDSAAHPISEEDVVDVSPYPEPPSKWTPQRDITALFSNQDMVAASQSVQDALTRPGTDWTELAIPFEAGNPFPLMPIFCFGKSLLIDGRPHLVFRIKNGNLLS